MLYLDTLKFNNIGRFTEEQVFDFKDHSNLLLIDGPSGVGKSTIFHSLDYLLGINTIPATQLQCRFTTKSIYVKGIFRHDSGVVEIERSKKSGLTIKTPTETVSGNVDLAEKTLDELIGIPRTLFKKIIHKPQRDFGFFLQMTAKQMHMFLIELLDLKIYQDKMDIITQQITDKNKLIDSKVVELGSLRKGLDDLLSIQANEVEPICGVDTITLETDKNTLLQLQNKIDTTCKTRDGLLENLIEPKKSELQYNNDDIQRLTQEINKLESNKKELQQSIIKLRKETSDKLYKQQFFLNQIQDAKQNAKVLGAKIIELKQQKAHAEANDCPTCKQKWVTDDISTYLQKLDSDINTYIQEALVKKQLIDQESTVSSTIVDLNEELSKLQSPDTSSIDIQIVGLQELLSIEKNKLSNLEQQRDSDYLKEYNLFLQKQRDIDTTYEPEITTLKAQIHGLTMDISSKEQSLRNYQANLDSYNTKTKQINDLILQKNKDIEDGEKVLELNKSQILVAEETKRLIKSYTLQIFQDTLDTIGENATQILSSVHNMTDASIYFEGCKETKTGTIRDEVNAIITKEGEQDIPIKTLSGGERTVTDLAVDLAVIDMIEDKVGKGANFFIIDEPFDGLDSEGKEQYLDILKGLNTNKQIILVDHSPELKEMISDVIKIDK